MRQWWVEYQFSEHAFEDRRNFMYTRFKNFKFMIFGCPQIIKTVEFKKKKNDNMCSKVQRMILTYPLLQRKLYIVSIYCIKDFETNPAIYSHSFLLSEFYDFHICQFALNRHYYRLHETFVLTKVWNVLASATDGNAHNNNRWLAEEF